MKINVKYKNVLFAFLMSFSLSLIISFVLASINVGYNSLFLQAWLKNWGMAFVIAYFGARYLPLFIHVIFTKITFEESHPKSVKPTIKIK